MIYLIGSLRNPRIPRIANLLRHAGLDVFADWFGAGETADDRWRDYEQSQGRTYCEALRGPAAQNVFRFDKRHLEMSDAVVLVAPAGKSAHLELGWALGQGKPGYVLLDGEPERWDVMYGFCTAVFDNTDDLIKELKS